MRILVLVLILAMCCSFQGTAEEQKSSSESEQTRMSEAGVVTGKVTFGPLRPGPERLGETDDPEILRKIYASHKVKVLEETGKKTLREVEINSQGIFKVELKPGIYFLQITPSGIGKLQKQAQRVEVTAGKTVQVDISVDTGMR